MVYASRTGYVAASSIKIALCLVALIANSSIMAIVWQNAHLQNQPNMLLVNLAAGDFLMAVGYLHFWLWNSVADFEPSRRQCVAMIIPILWALFISICSIVPLSYYRVKLVKAYSDSSETNDITEPWIMRTSLAVLWIVTFLCSLLCLVDVSAEPLDVCILPLAMTPTYLVSFFIFTTTICVMVTTEYARLIVFVVCSGASKNKSSEKWHKFVKFDSRVTRTMMVMAGSFAGCWIPFLVAIFYYVHPMRAPSSMGAHRFTHWVTMLPLLHSTINPFVYTLSEREFRDTLVHALNMLYRNVQHRWTWRRPAGARQGSARAYRTVMHKLSRHGARSVSTRHWRFSRSGRERMYTVSSDIPLTDLVTEPDNTVQGKLFARRRSRSAFAPSPSVNPSADDDGGHSHPPMFNYYFNNAFQDDSAVSC